MPLSGVFHAGANHSYRFHLRSIVAISVGSAFAYVGSDNWRMVLKLYAASI